MAITINECPQVVANLIPAHIQYTGQANTQEYFTNSKIHHEHVEAYFRGLKLIGKLVETNGYLLLSVDDDYVSIAKFDSFTIFGHDSLEPENQWELINEWYQISDVLNS
jgi:ribonuclease H2 subunit C